MAGGRGVRGRRGLPAATFPSIAPSPAPLCADVPKPGGGGQVALPKMHRVVSGLSGRRGWAQGPQARGERGGTRDKGEGPDSGGWVPLSWRGSSGPLGVSSSPVLPWRGSAVPASPRARRGTPGIRYSGALAPTPGCCGTSHPWGHRGGFGDPHPGEQHPHPNTLSHGEGGGGAGRE